MRHADHFSAFILIEGLNVFTDEARGGLAPQPLVHGKSFARVPRLKSPDTQVFPARGAAVDDSIESGFPVRLQPPLVRGDPRHPPVIPNRLLLRPAASSSLS
jgi:hypothetical protein